MARVEGYVCDFKKCDSGVLSIDEINQVLFLTRTYLICHECQTHMMKFSEDMLNEGEGLVFGAPFLVPEVESGKELFYVPVSKDLEESVTASAQEAIDEIKEIFETEEALLESCKATAAAKNGSFLIEEIPDEPKIIYKGFKQIKKANRDFEDLLDQATD